MQDDPTLAAMRKVQEAKDRLALEIEISVVPYEGGSIMKSKISKDLNGHLLQFAARRGWSRDMALREIATEKGSISEEAVYAYLFEDPRT